MRVLQRVEQHRPWAPQHMKEGHQLHTCEFFGWTGRDNTEQHLTTLEMPHAINENGRQIHHSLAAFTGTREAPTAFEFGFGQEVQGDGRRLGSSSRTSLPVNTGDRRSTSLQLGGKSLGLRLLDPTE